MRHILVTFAMCFLAISAYPGTYVETFDDGDFGDLDIYNYGGGISEWKVEDGILICRRPVSMTSTLLYGEENWGNYSIECDARIVEPIANLYSIGLDLRVSNIDNASSINDVWCLAGNQGVVYIWAWLNGNSAVQSPQKAFHLQLNRWYHLKAIANENEFEFYIDGELMASLSDSRFPSGRVGLAVTGSVSHLDNVVITGDDVPDNNVETAVSSSGKLATTWGQLRRQ